MGYKADVGLQLSIPGTGNFQEKRTIEDVIAVNSKQLAFCSKHSHMDLEYKPEFGSDCTTLKRKGSKKTIKINLDTGEKLVFVAIKTSRYTFTRCDERDVPGIGFALTSEAPIESPQVTWIKGDKLLFNVSNCEDIFKDKGYIEIFVDERLFDCSKALTEEIVVTVTCGIASSTPPNEESKCEAKQAPAPANYTQEFISACTSPEFQIYMFCVILKRILQLAIHFKSFPSQRNSHAR